MNRFAPTILMMGMLLALATAACRPRDTTVPLLRIGHSPHDHHASLYIAALNPEYFRENGGIYLEERLPFEAYDLVSDGNRLARVRVASGTGGKELIRKLAENHFDLCFGGFPAMLHFIDKGAPIRILAPIMSEGAGLVVKQDFPAEDWDGFIAHVRRTDVPVRIGYKIDISVQNLIFEQALAASGISFAKQIGDPGTAGGTAGGIAGIVLLNLHGAKNLIPALENGLIDGFVVMQPYVALAEEKGVGKEIAPLGLLPPRGRWQGHPCCAIAANQDYADAHPEVVRAMRILLMRANGFIRSNPDQSAEMTARWLKVSPEVEKRALPTIRFLTTMDEPWRRGVDFWVATMIEKGLLNDRVKQARETDSLDRLLYGGHLSEAEKE